MSEGEQASDEQASSEQDHGQQADGEQAYFADLPLGDAWGESITKRRAAELEARLQAWAQDASHGELKGPFDGIMLLTGADVFWLAARTPAGSSEVEAVTRQAKEIQAAGQSSILLVSLPLNLSESSLFTADLSGARLDSANLSRADLFTADLSGAKLRSTNLSRANLSGADLSGANLSGADLSGANLGAADLSSASLFEANLSGANLSDANLSGAILLNANLSSATLSGVRMNVETDLAKSTLSPTTRLADVIWNDTPLARIAWEKLPILGDEAVARQRRDADGKGEKKKVATRLSEYEAAVRAYRLLAVALRSQGLNEHADGYGYRAQLMQRVVRRRQRHWLRWFGSLFLWLIAGYGYRPLRSVLSYVLVIAGFAVAYFLLRANVTPPLSVHDAIVFSITSFHGRGFSPGETISLHNPLTTLAAAEAILGLLIEVTFIATFTNRFFAH